MKMLYKMPAVSFLVALCLETVEVQDSRRDLRCHGCEDVQPDNECAKFKFTCITERTSYCYNRMVSYDGMTLFVDRGCVGNCIHVLRDEHYKNLTWCCRRDYCNTDNIWPHDVPSELIIT